MDVEVEGEETQFALHSIKLFIAWLRTVTNIMIILAKILSMGMRNWMSRLRVKKLAQWEALYLARTEHPSVTYLPSDIYVFTIRVSMILTR